MIVARYTLELHAPGMASIDDTARTVARLPGLLEEAKENIEDLAPNGFEVVIKKEEECQESS